MENGKNEMVSTRRFAAFLTNKWSCRACGTRLASTSNCEVCAEAVNWECSSCGRTEDITHLHSNYSNYSSIDQRKESMVMNEPDMELNNRRYMIPNNNNELCAHMTGWHYELELDKIIMPESGLQFYSGISNGDLFNIFYEKVPVLREKNKETMFSRLALVKAFGVTLNNIFNVLGISALEKM